MQPPPPQSQPLTQNQNHIQNQNQNLFLTTTSRHLALQTRNPLASNAFIYSVLTTKIYCRPTCPSRLARRANIVFHDTPEDAVKDGFRACKRCRPDEILDGEGGEQGSIVGRVKVLIENEGGGDRGGKKWSVRELANEVGWTESHFCRVFKRVTGWTVGEYRGLVQERKRDEEVTTVLVVDGSSTGNAQTSTIVEVGGYGRMEAGSSGDLASTTGCTLDEHLGILNDGVVDFECLNSAFGFDGNSLSAIMEDLIPEDCFEFLDFGSPPPVALPV